MTSPHPESCVVNEQAVGWALHALEPDDEIDVAMHVPHCASCQEVVRDTEQVLASLGGAVEQVDPPRSLRNSILAAAATTPQRAPLSPPRFSPENSVPAPLNPAAQNGQRNPLHRGVVRPEGPSRNGFPARDATSRDDVAGSAGPGSAGPGSAGPGGAGRGGAEPSGAGPGDTGPRDRPPRHRAEEERPPARPRGRSSEPRAARKPRSTWLSGRRARLLASTLALVGVLTVGGLAVRTAQLQQERDVETTQAQNIVDLVTDLDRPGSRYAVLNADDTAVGVVVVSDGRRRVVTIGLDANPSDSSTYVLWGIRAGAGAAPEPIGTFDVGNADSGERLVGSDAGADQYATYAVSLEPGRTAPPAPSAVLAAGEVKT